MAYCLGEGGRSRLPGGETGGEFGGEFEEACSSSLAHCPSFFSTCGQLLSLVYFIFLFIFFYKFILFIYFWLRWVLVAVCGLSLVAVSGGYSSSQCTGLSLSWPLLLRSTGSRRAGSVVVAYRLSCSVACGIFPDQGSNPCPLHWQADS